MLSVQRERLGREQVGDSATRSVQAAPRPDGPGKRRISFDDVVVVACFLALIAIVVLGGAVMLVSWVTATRPVSPHVACQEPDGCVTPRPDENEAGVVDDHRTDGPMLTR